jgi:hypothetical protein
MSRDIRPSTPPESSAQEVLFDVENEGKKSVGTVLFKETSDLDQREGILEWPLPLV